MPEITANIVVEPITLTVTQTSPGVNVAVDSTNLNLYTATAPTIIGGNVGELQYRAVGNVLNGIANSNVDANGNLVFTNLSNVKIAGGTNGYYLQTDGSGNLTWAVGGGSGNGVVGGANTQVQYNDEGLFGGDASFTFDDSTQLLTVANLTVTDTFTGAIANATYANTAGSANTANTVTDNAQPNITSLGTLTSLLVQGSTTIQQGIEKVNAVGTGANGNLNYDLLDGAIYLNTANATGNFNLNFTGDTGVSTLDSVMSNNQSMTCVFVNKNGATPYTLGNTSIDGVSANTVWFSDTPAGTGLGYDIYTFNIIKTAPNTFLLFGSFSGATY